MRRQYCMLFSRQLRFNKHAKTNLVAGKFCKQKELGAANPLVNLEI